MPYLTCPGCGVRQYTPPLHVRRRSCPVCDTELSAGSLLRRPAGQDCSRLVHYVVQLLGDPAVAEHLVDEALAIQEAEPVAAPSARAAVYRLIHRRIVAQADSNVDAAGVRARHALTRHARLVEDLLTLPLEQRAAIILRTAGDLSHEEIAHVLDLGAAQTRDVLVKARVALAEAGQMS